MKRLEAEITEKDAGKKRGKGEKEHQTQRIKEKATCRGGREGTARKNETDEGAEKEAKVLPMLEVLFRI